MTERITVSYTEILKIAETMVNQSFDQGMQLSRQTKNVDEQKKYFDQYCRFFCYVDFDKDQIKGDFTPEQFRAAITQYIMYNPKQTVDKIMKLKDVNSGKSIHSYKTAMALCVSELYEKFYGN